MTTRKPTRGGLAALVFGLLIALFVGAQFFAATTVHAQAPAAAEPAAPAASSEPAPACDSKMTINCTPNSGDTAWMLTSVALVLMMTIPGLGLFYGGMVRKKNVGDTVMASFAITCLVTVIWTVSLLDGVHPRHAVHRRARSSVPARHHERHLQDMGNPNPLAPTIPETVYIASR
jgi:Amt family ammonium transporter